MRIAVEDWELYNNGILLCKWFDTEVDSIESIQKFVGEAKKDNDLNNDDLEMFIADVEGETLGLISGDESVERAYEVADIVEGLAEDDIVAVGLIIDVGIVSSIDEAIECLDDIHSTGENSMENVAYNYINDCGLLDKMPESLQGYFDYAALGRDMEINGTYIKDSDGMIWEYIS